MSLFWGLFACLFAVVLLLLLFYKGEICSGRLAVFCFVVVVVVAVVVGFFLFRFCFCCFLFCLFVCFILCVFVVVLFLFLRSKREKFALEDSLNFRILDLSCKSGAVVLFTQDYLRQTC